MIRYIERQRSIGSAALARTISILVAIVIVTLSITTTAFGAGYKDAEKAIHHGEFDRAVDIYRKLLEKDRRDMKARLGISYSLLKLGRFDLAYQQASQAVALDPLNARAHALFGTSLLRSGNFQMCIEEFKTALQFDPKEALAIAGLSEVDFYENRSRDSYDKIKLATTLDPDEPDYFYELGHIASRNEQYNEAANAYQQFLAIAPLKDQERRERIRGLVQFFRYIGTTKLMRVNGAENSTVPITLQKYRPYVDLMINGQGPFKFVLDSGASLPVVSNETAKKLGLKTIARGGSARAVGGTGSFEIVYGFIDSLQLGDVRIDAVPVFFRSLQYASDDDPKLRPAGYLGLSVLSSFLTTIDYKNQSLILKHNASLLPLTDPSTEPGSIDIPLRSTNNGLVSAEARIEGQDPLSFIIDTGATATALSQAVIDRTPALQKRMEKRKISVVGAAGITDNVNVMLVSEMSIANLVEKNLSAPILDFGPINETSGFEQSGILGGDFLFKFKMTFDLSQMLLRLKPMSTTVEVRQTTGTPEPKP